MNITCCPQCNGVISMTYSTVASGANYVESAEVFPIGPLNLCTGHLAPRHDGQLDEYDTYHVYYNNFDGIAISAGEAIWLTAKQALSLLSWLTQEKSVLERLAGGDEA